MSGRATSDAGAAEVEDGATASAAADARPPEYRYGVVFLLVLVLLVFVIVAPATPWSRAVALALETAALVSRWPPPERGASSDGAAHGWPGSARSPPSPPWPVAWSPSPSRPC
jgi:hypothetical protein